MNRTAGLKSIYFVLMVVGWDLLMGFSERNKIVVEKLIFRCTNFHVSAFRQCQGKSYLLWKL